MGFFWLSEVLFSILPTVLYYHWTDNKIKIIKLLFSTYFWISGLLIRDSYIGSYVVDSLNDNLYIYIFLFKLKQSFCLHLSLLTKV